MIERLPIFTYGTLKPSSHDSLIHGITEGSLEGYLEGYELRNAQDYPIAVPNPNEIIWGTIAWLELQNYDEIIKLLDIYEGSEFKRIVVEAALLENSCPIKCWLYKCQTNMINNIKKLPRIKSGFWA
jgi:gamma-glutamylcyclotransferase (GGCT)/AIG2-like uncharacterized protein YtfP